MKRVGLLVIMMLLSSVLSYGQIVNTGGDLVGYCKADVSIPDNPDIAFCGGYINGFIDAAYSYSTTGVALAEEIVKAMTARQLSDDVKTKATQTMVGFCAPEKFTFDQVRKVFLKYMDDHPERLHEKPHVLLSAALAWAFPCK